MASVAGAALGSASEARDGTAASSFDALGETLAVIQSDTRNALERLLGEPIGEVPQAAASDAGGRNGK